MHALELIRNNMFLKENLAKLNDRLAPEGLHFEEHENRLRLVEAVQYRLNDLPVLKKELQDLYRLKFDWSPGAMYWFIGSEGKRKLNQREIKFSPSLSEAELKASLVKYIEQIVDGDLKDSLVSTLKENEFYFDAPAALYHHHSYKHGLLEHSIQVIDLSLSMLSCLDEGITINPDIIIAGSILHDIGKINCYQFVEGGIDASGILSEQTHMANGIKIISQHMKDCVHLDDLIHIIASHHRIKDFGAIVEPISNEAWIISVADDLSSKIQG